MFWQPIIFVYKNSFENLEIANQEIKKVLNTTEDFNLQLCELLDQAEGKLSIGISEVKRIVDWNSTKSERNKFFIIQNAQQLTAEAQNSLLKVLEEPNNNNLIVIATKNPRALLQTIRSRAKTIHSDDIDKIQNEDKKDLFESILKLSLIEQFKQIPEFGESDELRNNIKNFIQFLQGKVVNHSLKSGTSYDSNMIEFVEILEKSQIANNRSVSGKIILENIFLNIPKELQT